MCTLPSFGFGSSTSLLCLFCWFDSVPTLLVQVDWASSNALWVPTLSVKSLYNRSEYKRSFSLQGVPDFRVRSEHTRLFSLQGVSGILATDPGTQDRSSCTEFRLGMRSSRISKNRSEHTGSFSLYGVQTLMQALGAHWSSWMPTTASAAAVPGGNRR